MAYTSYLLLKKKHFNDRLFDLKKESDSALTFIKKKVTLLEGKHDPRAVRAVQSMAKVLSKKNKNEHKVEAIKSIVVHYYFNRFKKRFCGFKQADVGLKLLMIWAGAGGFLLFGKMVYDVAAQNDLSDQEIYPLVVLSCVLLFILPVCFGLIWTFMIYAWFGILKGILSVIRVPAGVFHKTQQLLEAHMMALKPGGRNTTITFPGIDI